jgi:hypothetical protein
MLSYVIVPILLFVLFIILFTIVCRVSELGR